MVQKNEPVLDHERYLEFEGFLSETDKRYFDAIAESTTLKDAAKKLGLSSGQILSNWKYDLLNRRVPQAIGFLKCVSLQKFRSPLLRKLLVKKVEVNAEEMFEQLSKIEKIGSNEEEE